MYFDHSELGTMTGSSEVYERILKVGKEKSLCMACNRHIEDRELHMFEQHVRCMLVPLG